MARTAVSGQPDDSVRRVIAVRTREAIHVDGHLDEPLCAAVIRSRLDGARVLRSDEHLRRYAERVNPCRDFLEPALRHRT